MFLTYQAKMINFIICFHTQWEVFFQIKFYIRMKFYLFHRGMKLTCKQKFFHPGRVSFGDKVSCKPTLSVLISIYLKFTNEKNTFKIANIVHSLKC